MLAGIVQSPDADNPINGDAALARRTPRLCARCHGGHGRHHAEVAAQTAAGTLALHPRRAPNDCTETPAKTNSWGFFCDFFVRWWDDHRRSASRWQPARRPSNTADIAS